MKKTFLIIIAFAVLAFGFNYFSKQSDTQQSEKYTIGAALALTGDAAEWGELEKNGILLAQQEINANGGINGKELDIVIEDTQSSSKNGVTAVQKLTTVDNADIVIGTTWLDSYPGASKLVDDGDKLLITPSAGISTVQGSDFQKNNFSSFYRLDKQAYALGQEIARKDYIKIGIAFQNDAYFIDFAENIKKGLQDSGSNVEIITEFINYDDDGKASLLNLKSENIDALVFGMYDEVAIANLRNQLPVLFKDIDLYANDLVEWHVYGDDYRDEYEGATFVTSNQSPELFNMKYKEFSDIDAKYSASTAYDTVYMIAQMLAEKESNETYSEYMRSHSFNTETFGQITFDELGGVVSEKQQYTIQQVVDGVPVVLK